MPPQRRLVSRHAGNGRVLSSSQLSAPAHTSLRVLRPRPTRREAAPSCLPSQPPRQSSQYLADASTCTEKSHPPSSQLPATAIAKKPKLRLIDNYGLQEYIENVTPCIEGRKKLEEAAAKGHDAVVEFLKPHSKNDDGYLKTYHKHGLCANIRIPHKKYVSCPDTACCHTRSYLDSTTPPHSLRLNGTSRRFSRRSCWRTLV